MDQQFSSLKTNIDNQNKMIKNMLVVMNNEFDAMHSMMIYINNTLGLAIPNDKCSNGI